MTENIVDIAGDITASAIVIDDVDGALDELVAEGIVTENEIDDDGETVTYYRLAGDRT